MELIEEYSFASYLCVLLQFNFQSHIIELLIAINSRTRGNPHMCMWQMTANQYLSEISKTQSQYSSVMVKMVTPPLYPINESSNF